MESRKRVTLTFDNGPTPGVTERVLDTLAEYDVKSTFFVLGKNLAEQPRRELVARAAAEGHWIGNHTFNHATSFGDSSSPTIMSEEIGATQDLIEAVAHEDRLFRPRGAGGNLDRHLLSRAAVRYLQDGGYTMVLWSSVPRDWDDPDGWEATCREQIADQDWSVVVLHDMETGAMRNLPGALHRMIDSGIEIVQEFPDHCVPIRNGKVIGPIDHLVADA